MIAKRERLFTKAFPDSEMVLQVTSGSLFVQLQPLHLERHHNTAEDTVAQLVLHLLLLGPAVSWAVAGGVLAGCQLQTLEPQVTVLEFHVSGLTSTFFFPASAGE